MVVVVVLVRLVGVTVEEDLDGVLDALVDVFVLEWKNEVWIFVDELSAVP